MDTYTTGSLLVRSILSGMKPEKITGLYNKNVCGALSYSTENHCFTASTLLRKRKPKVKYVKFTCRLT